MLSTQRTVPYYTLCDRLGLACVLHGFINQISSLLRSLCVPREPRDLGTQALDSSRQTNGRINARREAPGEALRLPSQHVAGVTT